MIRLILVVLFLFLYLVVFSPALVVLWIVGKFSPEKKARASMHLVRGAFRIILFLAGAKLTVTGRENIPDDRPVLYVGNHRSFFDILAGYVTVKGECGFVAKKELRKVLFLRRWMDNIRCLYLDRSNPREGMKTIQKAIENIKAGYSMWIYPEGTRNHGEVPAEFKEGSMRIAEKTGCPVIPIAMTGTSELLEKHFPWIRSSEVHVMVGEPIFLDNMTREEKKKLGALARGKILAMLPEEYQDKQGE